MNALSTASLALFFCFSSIAHPMESGNRNQPTKRSYEEFSEQSEITHKKQKLEPKDQCITLIGYDGVPVIMKKSIARLSPTIEKIFNAAEENKESLENGIPFNEITGLQLQKIATILNNSVEYYGYEQVKIDLKGRIKKDGIDKEHETQYFLDDTIIKYLALHKGSPSLTPDLCSILKYFDLPLFKWVLGAKARESRMNLPFILSKPEIGPIVTEYLVDDNFKKIQNYILENIDLVVSRNIEKLSVYRDEQYSIATQENEMITIVDNSTNNQWRTSAMHSQNPRHQLELCCSKNDKYLIVIMDCGRWMQALDEHIDCCKMAHDSRMKTTIPSSDKNVNIINIDHIIKTIKYFSKKILTQEIVLLNAIQAARAKGELYVMSTDSQRIFNAIAQDDQEVGDAIRNALLPLIHSYNKVNRLSSFTQIYINIKKCIAQASKHFIG